MMLRTFGNYIQVVFSNPSVKNMGKSKMCASSPRVWGTITCFTKMETATYS